MAGQNNKTNKKFMVLSALGIFMVVDHHTFTALNLFGDFIPYNSFFMPMFVFISGYFNKVDSSTKLLGYTKKKLKTLIFPYILITLIVSGIQWLMNFYKLGEVPAYPSGYLLYILERVVTSGSPFMLAAPMWFVITLFATLMIYAVIKKLLFKIWNSYLMFSIFTALNFLTVCVAKTIDAETLVHFLLPLKVLFFLPFLELGMIYRDHLEKKHEGLSGGIKVLLLVILLLLNMIRTMYLPSSYDVAFDSLDELSGFTSPFIITPMVSSVIGITFWLTLVDIIGKPFYNSRFINYMSCNTFWIMGLHVTFFNILNCILMTISEHIATLPYFDTETFRETEWYLWEINPNFKFAYVIIGILGPLALKLLYDKICSLIPQTKKA